MASQQEIEWGLEHDPGMTVPDSSTVLHETLGAPPSAAAQVIQPQASANVRSLGVESYTTSGKATGAVLAPAAVTAPAAAPAEAPAASTDSPTLKYVLMALGGTALAVFAYKKFRKR